jgi:hypothetical protein
MTDILLKNIINNLNTALVGFNETGILISYNKTLADLWALDESFLAEKPNLVEFFETLREQGIYPEMDNFRGYLESLANILKSNNTYNHKQKIILPSGFHLQQTTQKISSGLLIFWEDTTNLWESQYNLNHYRNVLQKLVDSNPNPLLIVGSSGLVDGYNSKFMDHFNIDLANLNTNTKSNKPHIKEVIKLLIKDETSIATFLGSVLSSRSFNYKIDENNICYGISLPNSSMFLIFMQNFVSTNNQVDIIDNEAVKNSLSNLQNILVSDLNQSVQNPINNIVGLANLLAGEYIGNLNMRQQEYVEKILSQTKIISNQLSYKVALSEINNNVSEYSSIDINIFLSHLLEQIKVLTLEKNIVIKIDLENSLQNINHNYDLLLKFFNLCFIYIINQSIANSEINIAISQQQTSKGLKTMFSIKDTAKAELFSSAEQNNNYLVMLIFKIAKVCNYDFKYLYKNRSHRLLSIEIIS